MKSVEPSAVRDVLILSLAAGSADAIGFMGLGRVFTCNMTGNLVLLGIDFGQGDMWEAAHSAFVIFLFMCGVAAGIKMGGKLAEKRWSQFASTPLLLEKGLLALFAIGWLLSLHDTQPGNYGMLALLASAMGLQTAALSRLGAPGVGTTAITGTIAALVTGVVVSITEPNPEETHERVRFQFGVISIYALGATLSGFLLLHLHGLVGLIPAIASLAVWPRGSTTSR